MRSDPDFVSTAEVTGLPELEKKEIHSSNNHQEAGWGISISGVVTMEEKKEDERWRKLFPDMKKCVIVITRTRLDQTNLSKLKEEEQGGCARSRDREQDFKLKRFVKKVEFNGQAHRASADDPRGICHRLRRSSVLWLTHCPDVISDPAHRCGLHRRRKENRCDANNNRSNQSGAEHNYCLKIKVPDTPDGNSQSQDSR